MSWKRLVRWLIIPGCNFLLGWTLYQIYLMIWKVSFIPSMDFKEALYVVILLLTAGVSLTFVAIVDYGFLK